MQVGLGGADTLAFISNRWMFLDHEGKHTMLAGEDSTGCKHEL